MARTSRGRRTTGSIRRLPSGRYQARVQGDDGMLAPAPDTFATKADADRWLASMITDRAQGRWVDPRAGHVTLGAFADEWVRGKVGLAPKTCELYDYLLNHLILPALGDVELIDLTPHGSAPGGPSCSGPTGRGPRRSPRPTGSSPQ